MTRPENRWQVLLVADDGRIVPLRRIRGIVIVAVLLLVALALACAGLGWRLTAERVRHQRTLSQLADARQQAARYKRQHELVSAELVLAEARMEKAGLPIPQRPARIPKLPSAADAAGSAAAAARTAAPPVPAPPPAAAAVATAEKTTDAARQPVAGPAPVVLEDLRVQHDAEKHVLTASLHIENVADGASQVGGRCVVVLEDDTGDVDKWVPLPHVTLAKGVPAGDQGKAFRISRFIDLDLMAPAPSGSQRFKTAVVYVFDEDGKDLLKKEYPIDVAVRPPAEAPAAASATPEAAVVVDALTVARDAGRLVTRFRLKNAGPSSSPVAGRCVVVLHDGGSEPTRWLAIPEVPLASGRPDGSQGRSFRIARFVDMVFHAQAPEDASALVEAVVYVFDPDGRTLLDKDFSIEIPAPPPKPSAAPAVVESAAPPAEPPPRGTVSAPAAAAPVDAVDPPEAEASPAETAVPVPKEDTRSRF